MAVVSMKQLLEAGVHFGHQTRRWNPKMKPYIYTERNGIHIIDLQKTVNALEQAYAYIQDVTRRGGRVLFVGTKKQAQEAIAEEAARAGQYYVNQRWLGGLLTNFRTIRERLRYLDQLEQMRDSGMMERLPKKEQLHIQDEIAKLTRLLGGIREMRSLPDALFIIDTKKEHIAVHEAQRLGIPVVALVDTNTNPEEVNLPIPANDDAIRAVRLLSARIADAAAEGAREYASTMAKEEAEEGFEPAEYESYSFSPEGYVATLEDVEEGEDGAPEAVAEQPAMTEEPVASAPPDGVTSPAEESVPVAETQPVEEIEVAEMTTPAVPVAVVVAAEDTGEPETAETNAE